MTSKDLDRQGSLFRVEEDAAPWEDQQWGVADASTRSLFNPTRPINEERFFSGRFAEIIDLLKVIYEGGAHAIIHGERGVGKSSLANIIEDKIPDAISNIRILKDNCRREDNFFTLWSKMLFGYEYEDINIPDLLKNENRHFVVTKVLETLPRETQFVFVFDEFDRIRSMAISISQAAQASSSGNMCWKARRLSGTCFMWWLRRQERIRNILPVPPP